MGEADTCQDGNNLGLGVGDRELTVQPLLDPSPPIPSTAPLGLGRVGGQKGQPRVERTSGPLGAAPGRELQPGKTKVGIFTPSCQPRSGMVGCTSPGKGRPGQEGSEDLSFRSRPRPQPWLPECRH